MQTSTITTWLSFSQLENLVLCGLATDSEKQAYERLEKQPQKLNTYVYA